MKKKKISKKNRILNNDEVNVKIIQEISNKQFVFPSLNKKRNIGTLDLNFEKTIDILSKNVSFHNKTGGGIPIENKNPVQEIELLSQRNESNITNKGRLLIKVESVLNSKFPYYLRFITVLMKIFVCIMFSTLRLRDLGSKYVTKYILGLLMQYPDVCATITGGILSKIGSLGKQLRNIPVIGAIIDFIDNLTGGSLEMANQYLIKIGDYFQSNAAKVTPYVSFFQFMIKIAIEEGLDLTNPNSWGKILSSQAGEQIKVRITAALTGVVIKMLCPRESETCRLANIIMRLANFIESMTIIGKDFFEASLPLMKYYVLNKGNMSVDGLCMNVCMGIYDQGDALLEPKNLSSKDNRKERLENDMKLAYSTDESARKLRVQKFGSEDNAKNFYKNADNSKLMIDRMVDSASFNTFRNWIATPAHGVASYTINSQIGTFKNSILGAPKMVDWVLGGTSYWGERAARGLLGKSMPSKRDEYGNVLKDTTSDSYSNLKDLIHRRTLGRKGLDIQGNQDKITQSFDNYITKKNTQYLQDFYGQDQQAVIDNINLAGQQKARDNSAWEKMITESNDGSMLYRVNPRAVAQRNLGKLKGDEQSVVSYAQKNLEELNRKVQNVEQFSKKEKEELDDIVAKSHERIKELEKKKKEINQQEIEIMNEEKEKLDDAKRVIKELSRRKPKTPEEILQSYQNEISDKRETYGKLSDRRNWLSPEQVKAAETADASREAQENLNNLSNVINEKSRAQHLKDIEDYEDVNKDLNKNKLLEYIPIINRRIKSESQQLRKDKERLRREIDDFNTKKKNLEQAKELVIQTRKDEVDLLPKYKPEIKTTEIDQNNPGVISFLKKNTSNGLSGIGSLIHETEDEEEQEEQTKEDLEDMNVQDYFKNMDISGGSRKNRIKRDIKKISGKRKITKSNISIKKKNKRITKKKFN